jgi:NAD(P)-dependent dehydrogenase (short-subunit alcohol dehydrogenase family)
MTRIFAVELHETGVQFLSIDPGEMDTKMHADAIPEANRSTLAKPDDVAARILEVINRNNEIPNGHRVTVSAMEVQR